VSARKKTTPPPVSQAGYSLDEIETDATVAVAFWIDQAKQRAAELFNDDQAAVSGMVTASALYYLAERIVDACELVAKAIQDSRTGGEQ